METLERHFEKFRKNIIGYNQYFESPYGVKRMIYADWVASGRLYAPIENQIAQIVGPYVGNTHTETTETGTMMTKAYHYAHKKIKEHVNAGPDDVIITYGQGMTSVVNKFQRILGLKNCASFINGKCIPKTERPVVFVTHLEHHSNQTSWLETNAEVVLLQPDKDNRVDPQELVKQLEKYKDRKMKIGTFSGGSNVTGIIPPYRELAAIMHHYGGLAFVDFAASAPYIDINMHPENEMESLDAIFFSPHKFLGGPGSSGVLIFNKAMYDRKVPDQPGGGTVEWTNPWGEHMYFDDIELREDGGTPGFLQAIRAALAIEVKEQMGTKMMIEREHELIERALEGFANIPGVHILEENVRDRLGILSFYIDNIHYNLVVKLLNDRFGIQVRGGCACAGTYGHILLGIGPEESHRITDMISKGDHSMKPGFIRVSLHPTMTDEELDTIIYAIEEIAKNHKQWAKDYQYNSLTNEFYHIHESDKTQQIESWFNL
ncbi:MAG: aminotransferase class V-fold PLP-dependent enzyme [Bacteroidales bacterium]|nr:aminotransferase class V-fold PLP-dependent enzyme [Bacteroidales bacterium]